MSAYVDTQVAKRATILCLSGQTVVFEEYNIDDRVNYNEYHKREVYLLKYFFLLFISVLHIASPDQFQIIENRGLIKAGLFFYPYRIDFKSGGQDFFMWIVLVADEKGELFAFARTRPCEDGVMSKDLSNPELVWEKD